MINEQDRMRVLEALDILDSASEWRFDCVTALACHILGAPVAALSLVDRDRQWFKSKIGLSFDETPRSESFCQHTIRQNDVFHVEDAENDDRFKNVPLVSGDTKFKFYAGAPVRVEGQNIGAICVLDRRAHHLTQDESSALMLLAQIVASMLQTDMQVQILQSEVQRLSDKLTVAEDDAA